MQLDKIRENLVNKYGPGDVEITLKHFINLFIEEYNIMKVCSANNKYSVKCYEYFNNKEYFVIIMELCDKNLSQVLTEKIKNINEALKKKKYMI